MHFRSPQFLIVAIALLSLGGCSTSLPRAPATSAAVSAETPAQVEWKQIWENDQQLTALQTFQKRHGVYLETARKLGEDSTLLEEGPCGDIFLSLVPDTREVDEIVYEITSGGKILRSWNTGSGEILRVEGNRVYRELRYAEAKGRAFILAIDADGSLEITAESAAPDNRKTKFREIKCPKIPDVRSDYAYCAEDPASKRKFVFQRPCT